MSSDNSWHTASCGQRSEARLGLILLVAGFLLQAAGPFFHLGSVTTTAERLSAVAVVIAVWVLALVAWHTYVPWDENRTRERLDAWSD